jgi:hypothetical protein
MSIQLGAIDSATASRCSRMASGGTKQCCARDDVGRIGHSRPPLASHSRMASPSAGEPPGLVSRSTAAWLGATIVVESSLQTRSKTTESNGPKSMTFAPVSVGGSSRDTAARTGSSTYAIANRDGATGAIRAAAREPVTVYLNFTLPKTFDEIVQAARIEKRAGVVALENGIVLSPAPDHLGLMDRLNRATRCSREHGPTCEPIDYSRGVWHINAALRRQVRDGRRRWEVAERARCDQPWDRERSARCIAGGWVCVCARASRYTPGRSRNESHVGRCVDVHSTPGEL